jgi:hypothetical protein
VAGIRFEGSGQDTLTLGSQQLASGLSIQATGATVVTQDVITSGSLVIQAPDITVSGSLQGSSVALAASGWVDIGAASRIDAGHLGSAGRMDVTAGVFVNSGQLHADGSSGGQISIQADKVLNAGPITADGLSSGGSGGQVQIAFKDSYVATTAAVMSSSSEAGSGGEVRIDGGSTGHLFSSGGHLVTGSVGGVVNLFGREVVLDGATLDASGAAGGGSVAVGGAFKRSNPGGINAESVMVTGATTIQANALSSGGGGQVYVGSDQTTTFDGTVSARGGSAGDSGGLIEMSGKGALNYAASADAGALSGKRGTLLLDPKNITIVDPPEGMYPQFDLIDPHPTPGGSFGFPLTVLSNGNIVVSNPQDDFGGMNAGAVYLFDGLTGALISSLVGSSPGNNGAPDVGWNIIALRNDNYVVLSPFWNGDRGAVTWADGTKGVSGMVTDTNSLVGSQPDDLVGTYLYYSGFAIYGTNVIALSDGNYVVDSPYWNGGIQNGLGAVTWGNGSTG